MSGAATGDVIRFKRAVPARSVSSKTIVLLTLGHHARTPPVLGVDLQ
jgi:hypothetical protein